MVEGGFPVSGFIIKAAFYCRPEVFFLHLPRLYTFSTPTNSLHSNANRSINWIYLFHTVARPSFTPDWLWWLRSPQPRPVGSNHHAISTTTTITTTMAPTEWDPLLPNGNRQTGRNYTGILTKTIVYGVTLVLFLVGACF